MQFYFYLRLYYTLFLAVALLVIVIIVVMVIVVLILVVLFVVTITVILVLVIAAVVSALLQLLKHSSVISVIKKVKNAFPLCVLKLNILRTKTSDLSAVFNELYCIHSTNGHENNQR